VIDHYLPFGTDENFRSSSNINFSIRVSKLSKMSTIITRILM
jgi:hypothetical protein